MVFRLAFWHCGLPVSLAVAVERLFYGPEVLAFLDR